jgi:hypothetical protein
MSRQEFANIDPVKLQLSDVIRAGDIKRQQTLGGVGPFSWIILDGDDSIGHTYMDLFVADLNRPEFYRPVKNQETSTQNTTS